MIQTLPIDSSEVLGVRSFAELRTGYKIFILMKLISDRKLKYLINRLLT